MSKIVLLSLLFSLSCVVLAQYPFPPTFEVDLDIEPRHRFDELVTHFKPQLLQVRAIIKEQLAPYHVQWIFDVVFFLITRTFHSEMAAEVRGMADILGISDGEMFALQCYYEMAILCTTIVARDPRGHILLGHNLDYVPTKLLQETYYTGIFKKDGKIHFKCSGIAGYVGVIACIKEDKFAVTMNARYKGTTLGFFFNLFIGRQQLTWIIRQALTYADNYNQAFKMIVETPVLAGAYVIMAGMENHEGASITRSASKAEDIRKLDSTTWFVVQCNEDPWEINGDERTLVAIEKMNAIGPENITLANMATEILLQPPNLRDITIATVLMDAEDNYITTYITGMEEPAALAHGIKEGKSPFDIL